MTILWDRLRELARDTGMVNALGTGRRAVDRSDEVAQDAVAALDDDMRAKLRAVLLQYSRCTLTDITLAANLAGADRVEVLCSAGEVILCLLDERADMTMVAEVGSEVHRVMAAGVKLFVVIGPAWYPVRSYVEHYAIRGCTDDAIADLLARTERELILVESTGRNRVEKRRRHWAEMARRLNAEIERRNTLPPRDGDQIGQTFTPTGMLSSTIRLPG